MIVKATRRWADRRAWILSDRPDCASLIAKGHLASRTLSKLMQQRKVDILGTHAGRFERFPLLLKFLDVKVLSVQVHPRDDQTELIPPGDTGNTEAWIVLRAERDARIYAGLKPGTSARVLASLTAANADLHLPSFTPEPGQAVMIEAGTVHSLGEGVMVFEVQETATPPSGCSTGVMLMPKPASRASCKSTRHWPRSITIRG